MTRDAQCAAGTRLRVCSRAGFYVAAALLLAPFFSPRAMGQSMATPEEEYKKLIKVNEDIQPLGDSPFGERISLYDGSLSFSQVDVSVSGRGPAISVGRTYAMHGVEDRPDLQNLPFADWDIDLPQIFTVTANQGNVQGWRVAAGTPTAICKSFGPPPSVTAAKNYMSWDADTWWSGYQLRIPGQGTQELLRRTSSNTFTPGVNNLPFPIVTKGNWAVGCLDRAANDASIEGFLAVSPDGTKYWLDHVAYRYMPASTRAGGGAGPEDILSRREGRMLVTRIEDRFGNAITYGYTGDLVTQIDSVQNPAGDTSDERHVTIAYESGSSRISTVTVQGGAAGTRIWTYGYAKSSAALGYTLTSVRQPDGSAWAYNLDPLNGAWVDSRESAGTCATIGTPSNMGTPFSGAITHPSGLTGRFTVTPLKRGRSNVPRGCAAGPGHAATDNGPGTWATTPNASYGMAITQKVLTGAGLDNALIWSYGYSAPNASWSSECGSACIKTVYTDVTYPDGHAERSTFSNAYDWSEGQLVSETVFDGAPGTATRQITNYTYVSPVDDPAASAYPHPWGAPFLQNRVNWVQVGEQAPMKTRQTVLYAANGSPDTFTWNATTFDAFARPRQTERYSSFGRTVYERNSFLDDAARWLIGLPTTSEKLDNQGRVIETATENVYDAAKLTLSSRKRFDQTVMNYTFGDRGQLTGFTDANGHTTLLDGYKLGVPGQIRFADGTTQYISVDGFGQIAAVTNQASAVTSYSYDAVGRLARIDYPSVAAASLAPKLFTYTFSADARGMGGNHWVRNIMQGRYSQRTDFDVLLRPAMTDKSDSGVSTSHVSTLTGYDWKGRKTFESYPQEGYPSRASISDGVRTTYDALGRIATTTQSSELGGLLTSYYYLQGGARQTIDAGGRSTVQWFQAFDQPAYASVLRVDAPEGVSQVIERDDYGNPTTMTQGGIAKTLDYDSSHRLCRTWEPETKSEVLAYDAADNLVWSVSGLNYRGKGCGYEQVSGDEEKTTRRYDALNRITSVTYPHGTLGTSFTYDLLGNATNAVSSSSTAASASTGGVSWLFGRNALGMLTFEELSVDAWRWKMSYQYDANGSVSSITYPDNETIDYSPNALGQPTRAGSYAGAVQYLPTGEIGGYAMGNGDAYAAEETTRKAMLAFSYGKGGGITVGEQFAYDKVGNIVGISDLSVSHKPDKAMTYDGLSRLTGATAKDLATAQYLWTESYVYDALNNIARISRSGVDSVYTYDSNNLLSSISTGGVPVGFQYDARGNTVRKDTQAFTFDPANRLLSVAGKGDYMYDAAGRRVKSVTPAGTTYYAYTSAGKLMWQYDAVTADETNYIYLGKKLIASKKGSTANVIGNIDGVSTGSDASAVGWACATGLSASIDVHLYVNGPAGSGTGIGAWTANLASEDAIQAACHSSGTLHRFVIPISEAVRVAHSGEGIYVHGISPKNDGNPTIAGSGTWVVPPSLLAPATPSLTVSAPADYASISVVWSAPATATSYVVQQSTNGGAWAALYSGAARNVSIANPVDGRYSYRARACNDHGCSLWSTTGVMTVAHIPPAPASISVPATSSGSVTVSWPAAAYATSYQLEHSNGGAWGPAWSGAGTSTTVTEGSTGSWSYQVKACNANGCSAYRISSAVALTIPPSSAPSVSGGGTNLDGNYLIGWSAVAGASYYSVSENANGGGWIGQGNVANAASGWQVTGKPDGTYVYNVIACNNGGCGPWGNEVTVRVTHLPSVPAQPRISQTGTSKKPTLVFTWSATAYATRYELLQTNASNYSETIYGGSDLTFRSLILYNGSLRFSVRACNAVGCSAYGPSASVNLVSGS